MMTALALAGALFGAKWTPAELANVVEAREYRYTGGQLQEELFHGRLFIPREMTPGERYPLLVWLHGLGEGGSKNLRNLKHLDAMLEDLARLERYQFFILAVQCPSREHDWFSRPKSESMNTETGKAHDMLTVTAEILRHTMRQQPVDPDRVYVSGISSGGSGCWEMALRYPELFAAAAPLGGACERVGEAARLVDMPIWVFHNALDGSVPPDSDQRMVEAVKRAGGTIHLTMPPVPGHDCTYTAFEQYGAMAWMLAQRRGARICWTPPGCQAWKWWHLAPVPAAYLGIVWVGWCSERRRRKGAPQGDRHIFRPSRRVPGATRNGPKNEPVPDPCVEGERAKKVNLQ